MSKSMSKMKFKKVHCAEKKKTLKSLHTSLWHNQTKVVLSISVFGKTCTKYSAPAELMDLSEYFMTNNWWDGEFSSGRHGVEFCRNVAKIPKLKCIKIIK